MASTRALQREKPAQAGFSSAFSRGEWRGWGNRVEALTCKYIATNLITFYFYPECSPGVEHLESLS